MRVVFIAVLCLVVGLALGWQGQGRATPDDADVPIGFGDTAVMGAINEQCYLTNAGGVPTAFCEPRTSKVGQYVITIQRHRIFIEKEKMAGSSSVVFTANQPRKSKR